MQQDKNEFSGQDVCETPTEPTEKELTDYMKKVCKSLGFHFSRQEKMDWSDNTPHFHRWNLSGDTSLENDEIRCSFSFRTYDVVYFNHLREALGNGGDCRMLDFDKTINIKGENSLWYDAREGMYRQFIAGKYHTLWTGRENDRILYEKFKKVERMIISAYPKIYDLIEAPYYWAVNNYGKPFDDLIQEKKTKSKQSFQSLLNKVGSMITEFIRR